MPKDKRALIIAIGARREVSGLHGIQARTQGRFKPTWKHREEHRDDGA